MAKSTKRRKIVVFSVIGVALAGLAAFAVFRKREAVITIQTEKVTRRNLTELVTANGRIQPVVQVKISPEVPGEIIELPVKEGQCVTKGDLILKIKPEFYIANRNQAEAGYKASLASKETAEARMREAEADFRRVEGLFRTKLVSESDYDRAKAAYDVSKAQLSSATHQVEMSRASLASADDNLAKTTVVSPLTGTVSKLNSEVGERVVGTATYAGTEVMTIADLNEMEARVDIGEMDVVLIKAGQHVRLEVDAFKDRKFNGTVTEIANSSKNVGMSASSQEATKFEVKIRIQEKEPFRPGMSVTAEIETRMRTNVLTVPIASVTTRLPVDKDKDKKAGKAGARSGKDSTVTNSVAGAASTNAAPTNATGVEVATASSNDSTNAAKAAKADKKVPKPIEVVFLADKDRARMVPVKIGISDENYWEITEGLQEGQDVISGGFRAITRDLEDGKKIRKGPPPASKGKDAESGKDEKES